MIPRSIDAIVEQQVRKWNAHRVATPTARTAARPRPVITISREYGAQGAAIGRIVAERLGFDFWDREIVGAISADSGASQRVIESLDEQRRNSFANVLHSLLRGAGPSASEYFERLARVIRTISDHGRAVIVGRGANYLVDPKTALRVRVVAPVDVRMKGLMERAGINEKTARETIALVEKERATFVRQAYDKDVADPADYDLIINTGSFDLEDAVEIVLAAVEARFGEVAAA